MCTGGGIAHTAGNIIPKGGSNNMHEYTNVFKYKRRHQNSPLRATKCFQGDVGELFLQFLRHFTKKPLLPSVSGVGLLYRAI